VRLIRFSLVALLLACCAVVLAVWLRHGQARAAQGNEQRVAWATSRITGSPDAPPPYQTVRVFPKLTFNAPLDLAYAPGSDRLFVVEQGGKIFSIPNNPECAKADLFLDISADVKSMSRVSDAIGLDSAYGIEFHPDFAKNHYVYICYVLKHKVRGKNLANGSRVSRFTSVGGDVPRVDANSEVILLEWEGGGHNGGCLKFGHDGCLYISAGDQADPNPPDVFKTGQDISDLRSSILRIDVDHPSGDKPYSIPKDNPFVNLAGARGEVYAYGLRNPWRFSVDRATGNIWVGDVGWELWEMVHCIEPGGNYGWSIMEGPQPVYPDGKRGPTPIIPPLAALPHTESASITGGFVYRGKKLPGLVGHYIFGDWETRKLWAAKVVDGRKLEPYREIAQTDQRIVSFAEDHAGELVVLNYEGTIHRIVPNDVVNTSGFPTQLSQTGLFSSVKEQTPAAGVYRFAPKVEQWMDGAVSQRFVAIPGVGTVGITGEEDEQKRAWPKDSVLARTLSLGGRKVETQLLHFQGKQWKAYTYAWDEGENDARLVDAGGMEREVVGKEGPKPWKQTWHYASRAQCMTCHNPWADFALGFTAAQLEGVGGKGGEDQARMFKRMGFLPEYKPGAPVVKLVDPNDPSAPIGERARSYLHVNCSQCHRKGGGGSAMIDLRIDLPLRRSYTMDVAPQLGTFGIDGARVICPGDAGRSVLLYRLSKTGNGHMPKIGSTMVDDRGISILAEWIEQLPQAGGTSKARMEEMGAVAGLSSGKVEGLDRATRTTSGALGLALAMSQGRVMGLARAAAIEAGARSGDENIRDLFERFLPEERRVKRLGTNIDRTKLLGAKGDAEAGRRVFFGNAGNAGGLCSRCHRIDGQGEEFGPDLTHIAAKYSREQLLENLLEPSKVIEDAFRVWTIRTSRGEDLAGFIVREDASEVLLKDSQKQLIHVKKVDIRKRTRQDISAMPEGLLGDLTSEQAADLLELLARLK
jgi:putative heme-binding domain-containing protein